MRGSRYYVALSVMVIVALVLLRRGQLDSDAIELTPIAKPLPEFPKRVGDWVGEDRPLTKVEEDFIQPNSYVRRVYRRGNEYVNLFISYHGNKLEGLKRVHHSATICLPAAGWTHEQGKPYRQEPVVFNDVAKSLPLSTHYFTKQGADYMVTLFFSVDGVLEPVHRRPKQEPLRRLIDRMSESWTGPGYVVQVQIGTTPGGDPAVGYERNIGFLRDCIAEILSHFPARVDHE